MADIGKKPVFTLDVAENLYDKQALFYDSKAKFRAFVGGLGSGKTWVGSVASIVEMATHPKTLGAILAPTYPLLRDSTIRTFFEICPRELIKEYNRSEQRVVFRNNAEAIFRPCDDPNSIDRLRNINLAWAWMDEAALNPEYAWRILVGRLRDPKGSLKAWITTTPKGFGWIWEKWVNNPTENYFMVNATSEENVHLPKEYIETLKSEYTGVFARQEIYGQFVGHEGAVYPEFSRSVHVINIIPITENGIIIGIDI
uniref:Putative terminase n=1 Tax=viral metagenome TaxID=1070528 RepID=A0A6H2A267_9ZZZZ